MNKPLYESSPKSAKENVLPLSSPILLIMKYMHYSMLDVYIDYISTYHDISQRYCISKPIKCPGSVVKHG